MRIRTIGALMRKEVLQVFRDPPTLVQVLAIPLIQLVVLANATTFDTGATRLLVRDDDRTVASAAMVPLAPVRFSTVTGCFADSLMCCASARAKLSTMPPAGREEIRRMGLLG